MYNSRITGVGKYLPKNVVTNKDLEKVMDTSDEWIVERTGIQERRYIERGKECTSSMGARAAEQALERAGKSKEEVDFIVFATLSPDYYFPGGGVLMQREMGMTSTEVGALDVRNQCTGFIYALSVADQFIRSGMYKTILVVGSETHSMGLDFTTRGRGVSVIFGDGAGAVVLERSDNESSKILSSHLHSDGTDAEELAFVCPGAHSNYFNQDNAVDYGFSDDPFKPSFVTQKMLDDALLFPYMNGQSVFKTAVKKFPEVIMEALSANNKTPQDIDMLIPHQANLRISQFVQKTLKLSDDQVFNNIQKYGNTTAASVPIALCEAWEEGKIKTGDLVCLAAFGSGFTWGSLLLNW